MDIEDIRIMFRYYNDVYFSASLSCCVVNWSSNRMTSCAGICYSNKTTGEVIIKLSKPLLTMRHENDIKETLLHEMIHAYIFVNKIKDHQEHGSHFLSKMHEINCSTIEDIFRPKIGYKITIYHTFHKEVAVLKTHWWQCEVCGEKIKRSFNRKPQVADCRKSYMIRGICQDRGCQWHMHLRTCGGTFIKIKEPEDFDDDDKKVKKINKRKIGDEIQTPMKEKSKKITQDMINDFFSSSSYKKNKKVKKTKDIKNIDLSEKLDELLGMDSKKNHEQLIDLTKDQVINKDQLVDLTESNLKSEFN